MSRLESYAENLTVAWATRRRIWCPKFTPQGQRGGQDRIFFIPGGMPVLIEFKRKGKRPTKLQNYRLNTLAKLGYHVFWTDEHEEAIRYLESKINGPCGKCAACQGIVTSACYGLRGNTNEDDPQD